MELNKSFKKGFHIFVAYIEEVATDKMSSVEDHPVLKDFGYVFREIP
jgi:hypothetical protein